MYGQIGAVRFEGLKGFLSFQQSLSGRLAEMPIIGGKPRLQKVGDDLETIQLSIRLHRGFFGRTPQEDFDQLVDYMRSGQAIAFSDGAGTLLGNFVVAALEKTPEFSDTLGVPISFIVGMTLKEYVDPNPSLTQLQQAVDSGFATSANKIIPVEITRLATTADSLTSLQVYQVASGGGLAVQSIEQAAEAASQKESLFAKAAALVSKAKDTLDEIIERVNTVASIAAKAPNLLATMQTIRENADTFAQRIADGDLTNALTEAQTFSESLDLIPDAVRPLDVSIILREV